MSVQKEIERLSAMSAITSNGKYEVTVTKVSDTISVDAVIVPKDLPNGTSFNPRDISLSLEEYPNVKVGDVINIYVDSI